MKKKILSVILLIVIALAMICTCPGEKQHHAVMQPVMARVASQVTQQKTTGLTSVLKKFGLGNEEKIQKNHERLGKTMAPALVKMIKVHDYCLFSIGKLTYEGTTYPVSFGLFGHVFALPLDKIVKAMSEGGNPKKSVPEE